MKKTTSLILCFCLLGIIRIDGMEREIQTNERLEGAWRFLISIQDQLEPLYQQLNILKNFDLTTERGLLEKIEYLHLVRKIEDIERNKAEAIRYLGTLVNIRV